MAAPRLSARCSAKVHPNDGAGHSPKQPNICPQKQDAVGLNTVTGGHEKWKIQQLGNQKNRRVQVIKDPTM